MNRRSLRFALALAFPAAAAAPAQETLAIRAGSLLVAPGRELPRGVLLIRQGRVHAFGTDLPIPAGARVIDHADCVVAPGLVDLWTQVSARGASAEPASAWTPGHRAVDGLDLHAPAWANLAAAGVTSVLVAPEPSQVGGGLACLVKTGPAPRVASDKAAFQLSLTEAARQIERPPTSLAGQADLIRRMLGGALPPAGDPLARVRKGECPAILLCDGPHETAAAARLARELGLKGLLLGEMASRELPELLAGTGLGAAFPPGDPEGPAWRLDLPIRLSASGVRVAFCSGAPDPVPLTLRLQPARAVRLGMEPTAALAAVTRTPAELLGLEHAVGSLLPGRDADFLVLDGHPLDPGARLRAVYVDGARVACEPAPAEKEARR